MSLQRIASTFKTSIAACALLALAAPASAVVTFDFTAYDTGGNDYALNFSLDNFAPLPPNDATLNMLSLPGTSCFVSGEACTSATVVFKLEEFGNQNVLKIGLASATAGAQYDFSYRNPGVNILGMTGTFLGDCECDEGLATLNVSAVPEPSSWALFALGTGAIGWQLRRRRNTDAGRSIA